MVLNPNYNEDHDWEVVSDAASQSSDDQDNDEVESERQQLLTRDATVNETAMMQASSNEDESNTINVSDLNSTQECVAEASGHANTENRPEEAHQPDVSMEESNTNQPTAETEGASNYSNSFVQVETEAVTETPNLAAASSASPDEQEKPLTPGEEALLKELLQMGFPDREEIVAGIRNSGKTNADDVMLWMLAQKEEQEEPSGAQASFRDALGKSVKNLTDTIGKEGQKLGSTISTESKKLGKSFQTIGDSVNAKGKTIGTAIGAESKRIGQVTKRVVQDTADQYASLLNKNNNTRNAPGTETATAQQDASEGKFKLVTDVLTAAAVIGGGLLLAKGNRGAGATVLATGGAAYMAGEAMRDAHARRHSSGLNEDLGLHMN